MAGAMRPVVLLMLLASVLFVVDGVLDGVYPGGPAWFTGKYQNLAEISYVFAILNTVVAYLVARGSERSLMARIGLSAFFLVERPLLRALRAGRSAVIIQKMVRPSIRLRCELRCLSGASSPKMSRPLSLGGGLSIRS